MVRFGRDRDRHGVDAPEHGSIIVRGRRAARSRDRVGAIPVGVDDCDQVDVRQGGQNPGMMPPEMADADNR